MSVPVVLYARISDDEPSYDKPAVQMKNLRKLAAEHGYEVVDEFEDRESAFASKAGELKVRPGFNKVVQGVAAGKYQVVLAIAPDRLSRNLEFSASFKRVCRKQGVKIHTKTMGVLDLNDPMESAMSNIMDVFSELDVAVRMAKQADRFDDEISQGNPLWGGRPFGYNADRLTLKEDEAEEIRWAYNVILGREKVGDYRAGIYAILQSWNARGVLTTMAGRTRKTKDGRKVVSDGKWSWQSVEQLLRRERNAGIVVHHGIEQVGVVAQWESIVSREDYETAVALLRDPARATAPGRKPMHLLSTIATCAVCGGVMRSAVGNGEPIYKCSSKRDSQSPGVTHATIATRFLDPLVIDAVVAALWLDPTQAFPDYQAPDLSRIDGQLAKARVARQSIVTMIANGTLSEGEATKQLNALKSEIEKLGAERAAELAQNSKASLLDSLRREIALPGKVKWSKTLAVRDQVRERFDALSLEDRRSLVRELLHIEVGTGRGTERVEITHLVVTHLNEEGSGGTVELSNDEWNAFEADLIQRGGQSIELDS